MNTPAKRAILGIGLIATALTLYIPQPSLNADTPVPASISGAAGNNVDAPATSLTAPEPTTRPTYVPAPAPAEQSVSAPEAMTSATPAVGEAQATPEPTPAPTPVCYSDASGRFAQVDCSKQ